MCQYLYNIYIYIYIYAFIRIAISIIVIIVVVLSTVSNIIIVKILFYMMMVEYGANVPADCVYLFGSFGGQ
jgi:hypothetical protein